MKDTIALGVQGLSVYPRFREFLMPPNRCKTRPCPVGWHQHEHPELRHQTKTASALGTCGSVSVCSVLEMHRCHLTSTKHIFLLTSSQKNDSKHVTWGGIVHANVFGTVSGSTDSTCASYAPPPPTCSRLYPLITGGVSSTRWHD